MTTTTARTTAPETAAPARVPMDSLRKTALVAGVFYLLTFVSIPTLALYHSVRQPNYILGHGPDSPVIIGGILEMIVALAGIGTAVTLYPVLKRQNHGLALGFVGSRTLEAATIVGCVVSLMTVVSLRKAAAGANALVTGKTLIAFHDWIFLLGQSLLPAVNAVLLGTLLYRSRLVPRALPRLGLIGAPLLLTAVVGTMFGAWGQQSAPALVLALPIAAWEFSLGVYLTVKGFKPSAVTAGGLRPATANAAPSAG
jgi:hypothetical protein